MQGAGSGQSESLLSLPESCSSAVAPGDFTVAGMAGLHCGLRVAGVNIRIGQHGNSCALNLWATFRLVATSHQPHLGTRA